MTKKLKIQICLFVVSIGLNIWGILSILQSGMGINVGLTYLTTLRNFHILLNYVIIIVTMALGIMSATMNASKLDNVKWNKGLTIGITTYSTVLTVPLLIAFISFLTFNRAEIAAIGAGGIDAFASQNFLVSMFGSIAWDFQRIFLDTWHWSDAGLTTIYCLGVVMAIVFLGFPIFSAVTSIKQLNKKVKAKQEEVKEA